jgi:S-(hydroxymethyl)mycothiol dehydrogenase
VRAVIAWTKGAGRARDDQRPDPGPGEAVVKVQADGVSHTDLHYARAASTISFPPRARGVRDRWGAQPGVTEVAPGDFVVVNWRAVCRQCRACKRAANPGTISPRTTRRGRLHSARPGLGIGSFAEKTLVAAGQCTKVEPSARPAVVGLLGCGVMAGIGAAVNTGAVTRGTSVAVLGCGDLGVAATAGSALAGAYGRDFEAALAAAGLTLLRPARIGEPKPAGRRTSGRCTRSSSPSTTPSWASSTSSSTATARSTASASASCSASSP